MNRLDVTYEQAFMATPKNKYVEKMVETLVYHNDCHNEPLSNQNLQQTVSKVTEETEEEERNANNVTMYTFYQYPVTTNIQRKNVNVPNERRISSEILAETIKGFNRLTLHSTINNYAYYNSDEDDAESEPKSDQLVANHTSDGNKRKVTGTDTTNGISPQK